MNKAEEKRLAELAKEAADLRKVIDNAAAMMRSWAHRRKTITGEVYLSLNDRRSPYWNAGVHLPAEQVQKELVPILQKIRTAAQQKLRELKAEIAE
jgi:hypothetical protein